jgi:hydrophobe/amphiphile efflux-1 (HAE1) family protein
MCALLLKPHDREHRDSWWERPIHGFFGYFNAAFDRIGSGISWLATRTVRRAAMMVVIYLVVLGVGFSVFRKTPVGFIPPVDRGYIIVVVQLPPGASLSRTDAVQQRALDIAFGVPGIAHAMNIVGFSGATFTNAPNSGALFLVLDDYSKRSRDRRQSAPAIQAELNRRLSAIQDAFIVAVLPPPVMGIGTAGGFRVMVEDRGGRGAAELREAASALMARANGTTGLSQVFTLFETSTPQVYLDIDRTKAQLLGINVQDVFNALQIFIGSSYVNDFNLFGRTFRVTAEAREEDRQNIADVLKIRVRNSNGDTVPLGSFTTVTDIAGPYRVPRYNLFPAAEIDGAAAPGYSQGQAIAIMDKLAADTLPDGFATEWTTLAYQQIRAGNTAMFAFVLAVVFVFLVLAAQYESLTLPLAVIMIVPMCLVAAITGVILRGQDNNILTQVGFVVLIGLAAKNAILIVEFARQLEDQGRTRWQAAVEATRLRLRPILMTSFAFILGVTPLVWAIGAGAELRQTLGTAVFAGMIGVTAFGLVFTPVFYVIARWIAELGVWRGRRQTGAQPAE